MDELQPEIASPVFYTAKENIPDFPFKIYLRPNHRMPARIHTHDYLQIWYVSAGSCIHQINERSGRLESGDIFVIPPFVPHRVIPDGGKPVEIIGCEFPAI